jgi:hypothetical protein
MMGERRMMQEALFYGFSLERHVPNGHLLRKMDRLVDLSEVRAHLNVAWFSNERSATTASKAGSPPRRSPPHPLRRSSADGCKALHKPEASFAPHAQA